MGCHKVLVSFNLIWVGSKGKIPEMSDGKMGILAWGFVLTSDCRREHTKLLTVHNSVYNYRAFALNEIFHEQLARG